MRSRYPSATTMSLGPGPLTPAIRAIVITNVALFLLTPVVDAILPQLGLVPRQVLEQGRIWQPVTYMFLHAGVLHILFNMLTLWMFGVELERMWGTRYFTKYYFVTGVGAALTQIAASFVPFPPLQQLYYVQTVGASGAIYGVLLAYALYFPNRPIYMYFIFPIPAKYFVMIMGGVSLFSSMEGAGGVAHVAHLGGILAGYAYLKGGRIHPLAELKYRYARWRINRARRRFDVYPGGRRGDDNRRVH